MKISIVSPVYNKERFLDNHLSTLINQTYKNIEFIFVNDGSSDNSLEVLKKYQKEDERIIIVNQKNQGPNIARRNGFLKSSGEYVYFVDSDDLLYNNDVIKNIVEVINNNNNPDCIFVEMITRYENKDVLDQCLYIKNHESGKHSIENLYDCIFRGNLSSKIFKRNKIKKEYFINYRNYEDCFLSYCILNNCKNYYFYNKPIYIINRKSENNDSLTCNMKFDVIKSKYEIIDMLLGQCSKFEKSLKKLLQKMYLDDLNYSLLLSNEDANKLLKYLDLKKKEIDFDIKSVTSKHYMQLFILKKLYLFYYTNRVIKYINNCILNLKKIIRRVIR